MTAPRLTVIPGGGNVIVEDCRFYPGDDPLRLSKSQHRIRKRVMLDMLQYASIAIHRGDFERADYILADVRTAIANLRKRKS